MKVKYNNQEIQKFNYNGRYFDKVEYNGTIYCFGSYNEQSLQSFQDKPTISASINNAEVVANLYNGSVKVSIPDVVFGNSSLGIGVGHIYNSMMDNDEIYAAKWTFMGKGFKINYQQYLIKVNTHLYYYIDGIGNKHEIVQAMNAGTYGTTFYDTSGLGLILSENSTSHILTDRNENKMYFDKQTGFINETVNYLNHKTAITYDNLRIKKIVNSVNGKTRTMHLSYDDLDRLKQISYDGANKTINYYYKQHYNILESITKKSLQIEEIIVKLEYDLNNKLEKITNPANQTIKLFYLNGRIDNIQEGATVNNDFKLIKDRKITYNNINTMVTTKLDKNAPSVDTVNQIRMVYNYDFKGNQTTVYEEFGESYTSSIPSPKIGTRLMEKVSDSSISSFNGVKIMSVDQYSNYIESKGYLISGMSSNNTDAIIQSIDNNSEMKRVYTFSFWYQIIERQQINAKIRIYFDNNYIEKELTKYESGWNYISLEKYFPVDTTCTSIKVYIVANNNETFRINITDIRAISNVSVKSNTYLKNAISNDCFIT